MHIYSLNFHKKKIWLVLLLLPFCSAPQLKKFNECRKFSVERSADILSVNDKKNNLYIILSQNKFSKNPGGEYLFQGDIYSLENDTIKKYKIINRDEFAFHPIAGSIFTNEKKVYLYILNHAVSYQFEIEKYEIQKKNLLFIKRYRISPEFYLTDISVLKNETIILTGYKKSWISELGFYKGSGAVILLNAAKWKSYPSLNAAFQVEVDDQNEDIYVFNGKKIEVFQKNSENILLPVKIIKIKKSSGIVINNSKLESFQTSSEFDEIKKVDENKGDLIYRNTGNGADFIRYLNGFYIFNNSKKSYIEFCR